MKSRVMYIEGKSEGLSGSARIGRVTFFKTGKSLYYQGQTFQSLKGQGFKSNYFDVDTGNEYWISGCRKDGADRLYGERIPVEIDEDVREEYWTEVRGQPEKKNGKTA
ncbi:1-deoxy-D-xylulose-5-phosphate synthase [Tichowtungia aerotolerans]|uniref:1-deoxy-D-xylulose-5-phosphate synthase n=1 Tax=Tichowtungia aerotolerans TaxID=2697043 RepID=A0A6P1M144_9BACT|nr:1-deoxy-D-xylulose-5-phosphate synthase [Tichowtungia aerotolerans]QHI68290.1 1-deoxy-D-xylulose-5-phosphate synthase [Tichowtungia aerotolerans]